MSSLNSNTSGNISSTNENLSDDEKIWGFISWLIPLIGGIISLLVKPNYKYAKYWAYLSISFFIVIIIADIIGFLLGLIPFIGFFLKMLINIALFIVWVIGLIKSLEKVYWKPPLIYDIAEKIGISNI